MKKLLVLIIAVLMIGLTAAGCSKAESNSQSATKAQSDSATTKAQKSVSNEMQTVLNTAEYTLYQNIFYNETQADYDGKPTEKEGIFTSIYDAFSSKTRYYVWGYNDQTKCCDWQWELKVDDASKLPKNGSLISVKGIYEVNDDALDKFWIINPEIEVKSEYAGNDYEVDMKSMSNTLERVQISNIINIPTAFEGKSVCGYGRILDEKTIQDAYYDGSWTIPISGDFELPAFGELVEFEGNVKNGEIADCKLSDNTIY